MKTLYSLFFAVLCMSSCSKYDDSELNEKQDLMEQEIKNLKDSLTALQSSCEISSFVFEAKNNSEQISNDVYATITDSTIVVWIPNIMDNKKLTSTIRFKSSNATINDYQTGEVIDYTNPVKLTVTNKKNKKDYTIYVYAFTGLPVMYINTENGTQVTSKDEYVNCNIRIVKDIYTRASSEQPMEASIKGRGNSTWEMPKKPYQIKFSEKQSLLGEPKDKTWVLLANYTDKTNIRNETAFYMSRMSNLDWTPRTHFVELMLNDEYCGTYQLCEKIEIADSRVNVTNNGYLLEVDQASRMEEDDVYFTTDRILLNIKDPDVKMNSDEYNWIKNYVCLAETVLYSDDFLNSDTGYKKYIDINSFVDWYLINEIAKNNDAIFYSSCYMNIAPNGKLKMGPIWDFDIALGNINYNNNQVPEGFWIKSASWISRMFDDPEFVNLVKNVSLILCLIKMIFLMILMRMPAT